MKASPFFKLCAKSAVVGQKKQAWEKREGNDATVIMQKTSAKRVACTDIPFDAGRILTLQVCFITIVILRTFALVVSAQVRILLRTQIHTPRHAQAHALSNKVNKWGDRADGHCYNFSWI